ncbi:MAG: cupin domain-containing protein [Rhizomicrobium sp.]
MHLKEAELIYVMQGSGTLIVGGTMENAKPTKPGNLGGTAVSGGTSEPLAPGNFALVPEGVPHWFSAVTQGPLVTMSFHVPRPGFGCAVTGSTGMTPAKRGEYQSCDRLLEVI